LRKRREQPSAFQETATSKGENARKEAERKEKKGKTHNSGHPKEA